MADQPRGMTWDDDFHMENLFEGPPICVYEKVSGPLIILMVPDNERGGFKEHPVLVRTERRLEF